MNLSITLTQLRYIVAVDTHKHFAKAANACFVSQPTLSMQVQKIEESLGVEIFDRKQKPIQATDVGAMVIQQARIVLREAAGIETLIQQTQGSFHGTLKLGIIPTLAPYVMPLIATTFRERYPDIFIRVQELTTAHIVEAVQHDELDAGLIATAETGNRLKETLLFEEGFLNFISPNHPMSQVKEINREQLNLDEMWLLSEGHCFRDQIVNLCRTEPDMSLALDVRQPYFDCGYFDTLIRMIEHVGGMTLLPELAVLFLNEEQKKNIRPFSGESPRRTVRLIQSNSFLKRHLIEVFMNVLTDCVRPYVLEVHDA